MEIRERYGNGELRKVAWLHDKFNPPAAPSKFVLTETSPLWSVMKSRKFKPGTIGWETHNASTNVDDEKKGGGKDDSSGPFSYEGETHKDDEEDHALWRRARIPECMVCRLITDEDEFAH